MLYVISKTIHNFFLKFKNEKKLLKLQNIYNKI